MLFAITGLLGCPVRTEGGHAGTVKDYLFDDQNWRIRWMVVDTGAWLPGRKILIHPSVIEPLVSQPPWSGGFGMGLNVDTLAVSVALTQDEIKASPDASEDQPVTQQMEDRLYDYYGWDPIWGATNFGTNAISSPISAPPMFADARGHGKIEAETHPGDGDSHLRSVSSVKGYHVEATNGEIGHVENFLIDEADWHIRYLVIATRNWWPGEHVQLAPYAVEAVDWVQKHIALNVTREQVKSSPEWDPAAAASVLGERALHRHYGWPGYGW